MLIVNKSRDSIINTDLVSAIYIGDDNSIKAIVGSNDKMYRLGTYRSETEAKAALEHMALQIGKSHVCLAPDDNAVTAMISSKGREAEQRHNGHKPQRHGGS